MYFYGPSRLSPLISFIRDYNLHDQGMVTKVLSDLNIMYSHYSDVVVTCPLAILEVSLF